MYGSKITFLKENIVTQHYIKTTHVNEPVEVLIGWDRPLQRFFLVVEKSNIECNDDYFQDVGDYIYNNLDDKNLHDGSFQYQNLDYFKGMLANLKILVPENLWEDLLNDKKLNLGNAKTRWDLDGHWYKES